MHSTLERMGVERDKKSGRLVLDDGQPIPNWATPVARLFYKANDIISPEQLLWREVCIRLTLDALGFTNALRKSPNEHLRTMREAQDWFRYDTDDVEQCFSMAGIDGSAVQVAVLKIVDDGASPRAG